MARTLSSSRRSRRRRCWASPRSAASDSTSSRTRRRSASRSPVSGGMPIERLGDDGQHPRRGQPLQGLAHRHRADAERVGERLDGDELPGRDLAVEDQLAELPIDVVLQRVARRPRDRQRRFRRDGSVIAVVSIRRRAHSRPRQIRRSARRAIRLLALGSLIYDHKLTTGRLSPSAESARSFARKDGRKGGKR